MTLFNPGGSSNDSTTIPPTLFALGAAGSGALAEATIAAAPMAQRSIDGPRLKIAMLAHPDMTATSHWYVRDLLPLAGASARARLKRPARC